MGIWIAQAWRAAAAQTELLTGLGTRWNTQLRLSLNCRNLNLCPQRRLSHSDWHGHIDVVAFASEVLMPPDIRDDVKVAGRRAQFSTFAFSRHAHARTSVHAGRYPNLHGFGFGQCALAFTERAWRPAFARAPPLGTLLGEAQTSARTLHLTRPFARRASGDCPAGVTGAVTS